jgi:hypothetical protein
MNKTLLTTAAIVVAACVAGQANGQVSIGPRLGGPALYGAQLRYDLRDATTPNAGFFGVRALIEGYSPGYGGQVNAGLDLIYQFGRNYQTPFVYAGFGAGYMSPFAYSNNYSSFNNSGLAITALFGVEWAFNESFSFAVEGRPAAINFQPANPNPPYSAGGPQFILAPISVNILWNFRL